MLHGWEPSRLADLWSGVGLAATYAGGAPTAAIEELREAAGCWTRHLGQGSAFAAAARQRAGNPAAHTELACRVLTGRTAPAAAAITDAAKHRLPANGRTPAYEAWRARIREALGDGA
jgi:hypothetical protein